MEENKYFGLAIGFYFLSHQTTDLIFNSLPSRHAPPALGSKRLLVGMQRSMEVACSLGHGILSPFYRWRS